MVALYAPAGESGQSLLNQIS